MSANMPPPRAKKGVAAERYEGGGKVQAGKGGSKGGLTGASKRVVTEGSIGGSTKDSTGNLTGGSTGSLKGGLTGGLNGTGGPTRGSKGLRKRTSSVLERQKDAEDPQYNPPSTPSIESS